MPAFLLAAIAAAMQLQAQPRRLELGKSSARAVLHITSEIEPRLSASVGAVVHLHNEGPGRWTAEYVPPRQSFPQVALVAAVAGGELAWTAIPLWGRGMAKVQTYPNARISVEIGGQSFGPAQADENGVALVPVIVPPGVHEVRHRGQRIDLPVPPSPRLHVVLIEERVRADRAVKVAVRVLVANDDGTPRTGARAVWSPGRGEVSAARERAPGELSATWTVPPGTSGRVPLRAALADAPDLPAEAGLQADPGPPATLLLSADRDSVHAGQGIEVSVRATAKDAAGNRSPDPLELELPPDFGALSEAGPGAWRLRPPDSFGGRASVELVAHPRAAGEPRASVVLRLVPAEPASASIEPGTVTVRAGSGPLRLRVARVDRFGNVVPGSAPAASAQEGTVGAIDPLPDGAFEASYLPPRKWDREETLVEMHWSGVEARSRVMLLPPIASFVVSPKVGAVSNFARLTSPLAAVEAAWRTERLGPELALSAEAAWYFASRDQAVRLGTAQARDDFFMLSAQVSLRMRVGARTALWAGIGPSLTAVASRMQLANQPGLSESGLAVGALLSIGAELRFTRAIPFAEMRWSWHQDPALTNLTGAVSAASLLLGTRLELL